MMKQNPMQMLVHHRSKCTPPPPHTVAAISPAAVHCDAIENLLTELCLYDQAP